MPFRISALHLVWIVALVTIPRSALAKDNGHPEDVSSCRQFAGEFYRWYVPFTQKHLGSPASDIAIQRKPMLFDPILLRALKADAAAQQRSDGEIVGIDFDPFVGGQDPADHYDIRKATVDGDECFVEVWRNSSIDKSWKPAKPDAIAELSKRIGRWQFKNFRYPEGNSDLISELAWWREARRKQQ